MSMVTRSIVRFDFDRDVRIADAMASRLKPYVYENELYGLMPNDYPKLTLGGLIMRLNRLKVLSSLLTPKQNELRHNAQAKHDEILRDWRVAYEGKVTREFQARLVSLNALLNECVDNPDRCSENYPLLAETRVMAQALADEAEALNIYSQDMKNGLGAVDNKIRRFMEHGSFIWDERLRPAYPEKKYWYLYVK